MFIANYSDIRSKNHRFNYCHISHIKTVQDNNNLNQRLNRDAVTIKFYER